MSTFDSLLPHCTVYLVGLANGIPVSMGTGFYYFFNDTFTDENGKINEHGAARIGIVTNKHVVENIEEIVYYFNSIREGETAYESDEIRMRLDSYNVIQHPNPNTDLCVILADHILKKLKEKYSKFHMYPVRKSIRIDESKYLEMETIQNLIMIGYPRGLWDSVNNLPIIRSGINATPLYSNYRGENKFALDIALYPGSSGSPVFIYDKGFYLENNNLIPGNRIIFVGIVSSGHAKTMNFNDEISITEMLHVGIAIKASELDVFEELIRESYEE